MPQRCKPAIDVDRKFYVYVHRRKSDGSIFYVGKGCGNRMLSQNGRNGYWRNVAKKHGWHPEFVVTDTPEPCSFALERVLIYCLSKKLTNLATGGQGSSGTKRSDAHKAALSEKMRGPNNPMYGVRKSLTEDHKRKIGIANRKPKPDGFGEKMSQILKGKTMPEYRKAKIAESMKAVRASKPNPMQGRTRESAPKFDHREYTLCHRSYGIVTGTTYDIERKFVLKAGSLRRVVKKERKTAYGWSLA